jgi:hypothetical protein
MILQEGGGGKFNDLVCTFEHPPPSMDMKHIMYSMAKSLFKGIALASATTPMKFCDSVDMNITSPESSSASL